MFDILNQAQRLLGFKIEFDSLTPLSGGDINDVYTFEASQNKYVLKVNSAIQFPEMFNTEKLGLEELLKSNTISIPKVIGTGETETHSFLILEYIEKGNSTNNFWVNFGRKLAQLHLASYDQFGFSANNYIGSLPQKNDFHNHWIEFFIQCRLLPQFYLAEQKGHINLNSLDLEHFFKSIEELFPIEKPSLLHGDLWSGNFIVGQGDNPFLIDPAVYYGHREMDIAMTRLFGGFDETIYQAYQEVYPLEKGYREREDLCNLYPLLVHLNLFGSSYLNSVINIVKRFS